ncbi:hypothetical protein GQ44DRAFT_723523 [Phaeosphaeriaceae sp. PMI808]|nr:hypothetical protein GQ44DRAFT_723523 [Phaeosphaeriaceae sp. PMI808]
MPNLATANNVEDANASHYRTFSVVPVVSLMLDASTRVMLIVNTTPAPEIKAGITFDWIASARDIMLARPLDSVVLDGGDVIFEDLIGKTHAFAERWPFSQWCTAMNKTKQLETCLSLLNQKITTFFEAHGNVRSKEGWFQSYAQATTPSSPNNTQASATSSSSTAASTSSP